MNKEAREKKARYPVATTVNEDLYVRIDKLRSLHGVKIMDILKEGCEVAERKVYKNENIYRS